MHGHRLPSPSPTSPCTAPTSGAPALDAGLAGLPCGPQPPPAQAAAAQRVWEAAAGRRRQLPAPRRLVLPGGCPRAGGRQANLHTRHRSTAAQRIVARKPHPCCAAPYITRRTPTTGAAPPTHDTQLPPTCPVHLQVLARVLHHMRAGSGLAGSAFWVLAAPSYPDHDGFTVYLSQPPAGGGRDTAAAAATCSTPVGGGGAAMTGSGSAAAAVRRVLCGIHTAASAAVGAIAAGSTASSSATTGNVAAGGGLTACGAATVGVIRQHAAAVAALNCPARQQQ